jgi:hypothetical protein
VVTDAMPAADVVRMLADGDRLRVVAALVLGRSTVEDVAHTAGLDVRRAGRALARLSDAGLAEVERCRWRLRDEELRATARAAAGDVPADEHGDEPPELARVLRAFVRNGRLASIPAVRSKRRIVLDHVAQAFEPGVRYPEAEVNAVLARWHPDTAALRRSLVDEAFLERSAGRYWRSGGSVVVARADHGTRE